MFSYPPNKADCTPVCRWYTAWDPHVRRFVTKQSDL